MKKILMTIAAAFVAVSMNAQDLWVGGSLGYTSSHDQGNTYSDQTLTVKPEIGFQFSENLDFAIALGFSRNVYDNATPSRNTFSIQPYARYKFLKAGGFTAFVDGGLDYSTTHNKGDKNNTNKFGVFVTPGIAYAVSDKVTLVSHLGNGLFFNHEFREGFEGDADHAAQRPIHTNNLGLQLFNGVSFGLYVNL